MPPDDKVITDDESQKEKSASSQSTLTIKVGDREFSPEDAAKEIERLSKREKELQSDYTKKTTAISKTREEVEEEKGKIAQEKGRLSKEATALRKDLDFYSSHEKEEWGEYESEYGKLTGYKGPASEAERVSSSIKEEIAEMKEKIDFLVNTISQGSTEKVVDGVIATMDKAVEKFPLASDIALTDRVYAFRAENKKYPTESEIFNMAKELNDDLAKKGVTITRKSNDSGNGREQSRSDTSPPPETVIYPDLRDASGIDKALDEYRKRRAATRSQ